MYMHVNEINSFIIANSEYAFGRRKKESSQQQRSNYFLNTEIPRPGKLKR